MSDRREISANVKQVVELCTGFEVRVGLGTGTAHSWVHIWVSEAPPSAVVEFVEALVWAEGWCGSYLPDWMPGQDLFWQPNISWKHLELEEGEWRRTGLSAGHSK